ncbi:MAG: cyclic nucleotide-binding domain-containing protein [Defluviitaleaceae bacterium]|nr:cyclic nucleotide-binding domain-containing protein [Defluviitaleaceae bacterium]
MIDIGQLKDVSTAKMFQKGSVIIRQGDGMPFSMYVILAGVVDVYKNYQKPKERFLATLRAGDFFGEMSLFLKKPRSATVIAAESTMVLEIDQQNAVEIMSRHPDISMTVIQTLCKRQKDTLKKIEDLSGI